MQVLRQHHPAMDDEGMPLPHRCHRLAQQIHMPDQQVIALPLQQVHGEEISTARMPGATLIRHGGRMKEFSRGAQREGRDPKSHVGWNKRSALHRMVVQETNSYGAMRYAY